MSEIIEHDSGRKKNSEDTFKNLDKKDNSSDIFQLTEGRKEKKKCNDNQF